MIEIAMHLDLKLPHDESENVLRRSKIQIFFVHARIVSATNYLITLNFHGYSPEIPYVCTEAATVAP